MGLSLQEQLLKAGLVKKAKAQEVATEKRKHAELSARGQTPKAPTANDLARAYAERAKAEKQEADRILAEKQREQAERRARNERLRAMLEGKSLNRKDAEIARNFEYGGKIRRVYVTEDQLKAINSGNIGIAQVKGSYMLVDKPTALRVRDIAPENLALLVESSGPESADYADPQYAVPDDLIW